jgi:dienelactone hydrolase
MKLIVLAAFFCAMVAHPQTGWRRITFKALPVPATSCKFNHQFNAAQESFELYVPRHYTTNQPCGVLVWISPNEEAKIPRQFEPLFDEFRLLAITTARCGNKAEPGRREALAMAAALQLSKSFAVDRKRFVVSGLSGGGRFSALACFAHPDFWRGAISWCGGFFYANYDAHEKGEGWRRNGINHYFPGLVTEKMAAAARENCRFALITGPKDVNLDDCRDIDAALAKEKFQHLLIEEPGLGHAVGSNKSMRQALEFVLGASSSRSSGRN